MALVFPFVFNQGRRGFGAKTLVDRCINRLRLTDCAGRYLAGALKPRRDGAAGFWFYCKTSGKTSILHAKALCYFSRAFSGGSRAPAWEWTTSGAEGCVHELWYALFLHLIIMTTPLCIPLSMPL